MADALSSPQAALTSAVRKHCEALIKAALGYDPVLVHAPDGKKVLTYRTADDRDWLVVHLTDALLAAGYWPTPTLEEDSKVLEAIQSIIRAKLARRYVLTSIAPGYGGLGPRTDEDTLFIIGQVAAAFVASGYRFIDGRQNKDAPQDHSPSVASWVGVVQEFIAADTFTAHLLPTEESKDVAPVLADFSVEDLGGGPVYVDDIFYVTVTSSMELGKGRQHISSIRRRPRRDSAASLIEAMR